MSDMGTKLSGKKGKREKNVAGRETNENMKNVWSRRRQAASCEEQKPINLIFMKLL